MRSWLIALRIARREAQRAKGRTLLIIIMIALPVAALSFAAATYDMYRLTPTEQITRQMGAADAIMNWQSDDSVLPNAAAPVDITNPPPPKDHSTASLLTHLPPGSRVTDFWSSSITMRTAAGVGNVGAYGIDLADSMTHGLVKVDSGRAPTSADEVLASPAGLTRLGKHVGDTVTAAQPSDSAFPLGTYRIVGVAEVSGQLNQYLIFAPSQSPDQSSWLVKTPGPVTEAQYRSLGQIGIQVQSRQLILHPPADLAEPESDPTVAGFSLFGIGTIISGLGLLEVVLLAGPAFAVGARRRERSLALVATSGGTPSTLRRIVLADGVVSGVAAAIVGLVIGLSVAALGRPVLETHLLHQRFGAYRVNPVVIVAVVGLALATGLLGALVPAFTAARQDVVAALTGRRGAVKSKAVWLVLGLVGIVLGAVVAVFGAYRHNSNLVLAGLVLGEFGAVLCTPTLIGFVARFGRFLPVAPRIALRDTARRRAAAAPAISAVMAAVAGSVALTVYLGASSSRDTGYKPTMPIGSVSVRAESADGTGTPTTTAIDTILTKALPGSKLTTVDSMSADYFMDPIVPPAETCPFPFDKGPLSASQQRQASADHRCDVNRINMQFSNFGTIVTLDPAVLTAVLGTSGSALDPAVDALTHGNVVTNDSRFVSAGKISLAISIYKENGSQTTTTVSLPATLVPAGDIATTLVISPATASALGIKAETTSVVATPLSKPSTSQQDRLTADLSNQNINGAYVELGPERDKQIVAIILAIAAGVIALGAAAIATGLAAVDGRADLRALGAIGATPRVRRILALSQTGVIAGLGSLLGAAVGFGAAAAVLFGLNQVYAGKWPAPNPYPIEVPWLNLLISVVAVPLVAIAGAGLLTRSRLPIERRAD